MKIVRFLSFCVFAAILVSSCKKGDTGPQGAAGAPGAAGPQGPAGTANVLYSNWVADTTFTWTDSTVKGQPYKIATLMAKSLTQGILDTGAVLVYAKLYSDSSVNQLPFNIYNSTAQNSSTFDMYLPKLNVGSISVLHTRSGLGKFTTPTGNNVNTASYRYILIPGGTLAPNGRYSSNTAAGYTTEQLRNMSYDQVANLFHLPNYGSNIK